MRWKLVFVMAVTMSRGAAAAPALERGPQPRELNDESVIAALVDSLADLDAEVRSHLGAALANYGPRAVPPLLRALKDANRERRAGAAYALAQMRPAPAEALPGLLQAVKDPEEIVRRQAAYALSRVTRSQLLVAPSGPDIPIPPPDTLPGNRQ